MLSPHFSLKIKFNQEQTKKEDWEDKFISQKKLLEKTRDEHAVLFIVL